jgi:RHS repeat-associated protein
LKRLQSASGKNWGETYAYDGYGNLTQMNPTGTAGAPALSLTVALDSNNVPTNRIAATGVSYDNNGNQTAGFGGLLLGYDAANRVTGVGGSQGGTYAYDSDNRRIYRQDASGTETIYFYGVDGKKLATYTIGFTKTTGYLGDTDYTMQLNYQSGNVYFAGRLIRAEGNPVTTDRLGSVRNGGPGALGYQAQYPYGVEYTLTVNDREKYATYTRDSVGLDYAMNRYYASQWGRFLSPDPYLNSAGPTDPGSWNRYGYTRSDPVNRFDPEGLLDWDGGCPPDVICVWGGSPGSGPGGGGGGGNGGGSGPIPCVEVADRIAIDPFFRPCGGGGGSNGGSGGGSGTRPAGSNGARQDLGRVTCYQYFGFASAAAAQAAFASINFVIVNLGVPQVQPVDGGLQIVGGPPPAQWTGGNTVQINYSYNWFDFSNESGQNTATGQPTTFNFLQAENDLLGTNMNTSQLAALILLHEFEHSPAGGNAPQELDNKAFNLPIYQNCIGPLGPPPPPTVPPVGRGPN